ncbi:MAG TPA: hypothetical protein VHW95_11110 [Steroidobacteraceae bacterium]|nr:hypothetical protein [Steroidobacteraceae bacterium]
MLKVTMHVTIEAPTNALSSTAVSAAMTPSARRRFKRRCTAAADRPTSSPIDCAMRRVSS